MLPFTKQPKHRTVVITRLSALTAGHLLVRHTWQPQGSPEMLRHVIHDSVTASTDPLDDTLRNYTQIGRTKAILQHLEFSPETGISGNVWHHGDKYNVAVKGMPERIIDHCDLTENEREQLLIKLHALSAKGDYVIAFASGQFTRTITSLVDFSLNEKLTFAGFASLRVDVTPAARQLVRRASSRGTHVALVTGQYPTIGLHIGRQLGLARSEDSVLDARQLAHISDSAVRELLREHTVITRADHTQKRRIRTLMTEIDSQTAFVETTDALERELHT